MNDLDVSVCDNISGPSAAYLHATHVPPRLLHCEVIDGHGEHQVDRIIHNAHFVHSWIARAGVIRPR